MNEDLLKLASKAASPDAEAEWMRFIVWVVAVACLALLAVGTGHLQGWKVPFILAGAIGGAFFSNVALGPVEDAATLGKVAGASLMATSVIALAVAVWNP